jgi:hypothetical protein
MVSTRLNVATESSRVTTRWQEALHGIASSPGVTFA